MIFFFFFNLIAMVSCSLVSVSWSRILLRQHMVRGEQLQLKNNMGLVILHPAHLCITHCMQRCSQGAAELQRNGGFSFSFF